MLSWCDRADTVLAAAGRTVLVHGDFHGDNHLWDRETLRLRLVVDLETVGVGLWRAGAGVPLPDNRTPAQWVDDLAGRFAAL